ncbi:hypothetical protein [Ornithinimicrobium murale]|uniref:hypothetical protein n=1 Tax=Ornithinimicrobium murale TaxID=1050153 RepID=UPI000E0DBB8C|nr:hypothetical protein [Ornithinimicrobium murale]
MSTPSYDESKHPRGDGGRFATKPATESDTALGDPPQELSELGLTPGQTLTLDDYDTGSQVFEQVEIAASHAGDYTVKGRVYVDLTAGLDSPGDADQQKAWLDERRHVIEASLHDRYGALLENTEDGQNLVFTSRVPADASTDDVIAELENSTRSLAAHEDLHGQTAGQDYAASALWSNLRRDLDDHAQDANEATAAYEQSLELMETDGDAGTVRMTSASREQARRDVSRFLTDSRHMIEAAKAHQEGTYDNAAIGRDLAHARSGMAAGFDNGALGMAGPDLQKAAEELPPMHTWVDKNNDLHVEFED